MRVSKTMRVLCWGPYVRDPNIGVHVKCPIFAYEQSSILAYPGLREGMPEDIGIMQKVPKAIGPPPRSDAPSVQDSKTKA